MSATRLSSKLTAPVWSAFRRHSHRLLAIGYREALSRIRIDPDEETDITGYICEAIESYFRKHPEEFPAFFVKDDPPLGGIGKTGKRRSRTDVIISYSAGTRPEFFFEAKRLHRRKAPASRYTADGGMGCFVSGRYAGDYTEAAMIGYIQTDTIEYWNDELRKRIQNEAPALNLTCSEHCVTFASAFPLQWATNHSRDGRKAIRLFHILLDCRKQ